MKKIKRILFVLFLTSAIALVSCQSYQSPGKTGAKEFDVDLGAFTMHAYELGNGPLVVFSGGSGVNDPFFDLKNVIIPTSAYARTLTYERSGYGKSSQSSEPIDLDTMADYLNTLVSKFDTTPKLVLVGHSYASLELIRFAQKYPTRVKGIVLIDGAPPKYYRTWEPGPIENLPKLIQNEAKILKSNAEKVIVGGSLENIPIVYFVAGSNGIAGWEKAQEEFKTFSDKARSVFVKSANHFIHWTDSRKIVEEIKALIGE